MIEMENGQAEIPARSQLEQNMQQTHGVRAARYRHAYALARLEHAEALDGLQHTRNHTDDSNNPVPMSVLS